MDSRYEQWANEQHEARIALITALWTALALFGAVAGAVMAVLGSVPG
jgi:hypothetical protein